MSQIQIPKGWKNKNLENICTPISGNGFPREFQKIVSEGVPFLKVNDMNSLGNEKYIVKANFFVNDEIIEKIKAKKYPKGTIIFPKIGGAILTNKKRILSKDSCFDNNIMGLIPNEGIEPLFLYYFMLKTNLKHFVKNGPIPSIDTSKIKHTGILIPSPKTQKKIVQKLDFILGQLKEKKKSILELKKELQTRLEYLDKKFVDDIIDQIFPLNKPPLNWEKGTVTDFVEKGHIIEFQDGNHGELHPKKSDFSDVGRHFITAKQIDDNGNVLLDTCKRLPEEFCKKLRIGFTEPNDVLFTHNATVGRVAILPSSAPSSIIGTSVTYYRLNKNKIFNTFFFYLFRSRFIRRQYEPIMKQTTRNQFSILKQAKLNLVIPPLVEQYALVKKLERLFLRMKELSPVIKDLIEKQKKAKKEIDNIQLSILNQIFTGKLVI